MTNGDKIRTMSNEELAEFLSNEVVACVFNAFLFGAAYEKRRLQTDFLTWLNKEMDNAKTTD